MKAAILSVRTNGAVLRCELRPDELVTVGRSSGCGLQVADASVSREHCVVTFTGGKVCINDLRSTHGLFKDGRRVDRLELAPGESCRLGKALATFEAEGAQPQTAAPAAESVAVAEAALSDAAPTEPPQRPAPQSGRPGAAAAAAHTVGGYRLIEQIGAGGYGTVYRAEQVQLGREVAVKVLKEPEGDPDHRRIEAFLAEARVAARLSDPHLVQVFDVGEDDGTYFLSMELVRGGSLAQRIKRDGPLSWQEAIGVRRDVAQALKAAHAAGLVHRDVKPGNVLLTEVGKAKLTDLGLAADDAHAGTIAFMAPEQLRRETVDLRADLYALGCTVYAALAGAPPFQGDRKAIARAHVREAPPSLLAQGVQVPYQLQQLLLNSLLAKDPEDRPADADALLARLDRLVLPSATQARVDADLPGSAATQQRQHRGRSNKALSARLAAESVVFTVIAAVVIALLLLLKMLSPDLDIYRLIGR